MDNKLEKETGSSKTEVVPGQTWRVTLPEGHYDFVVKDIVTKPGSKDPTKTYRAAILDVIHSSETEPIPQEGSFPVNLIPRMAELVEG